MDPVDPVPPPAPDAEEEPVTLELSNAPVSSIRGLKVVDYSDFYKADIDVPDLSMTGTSPAQENPDDPLNDVAQEPNKKVPYQKFLDGAVKQFEEGDFRGALGDFKIILSQYRDDLNAHFYGALCYYNLGKSDKAIKHLDAVLDNYINTFDQEAAWYKALSLKRKGDLNAARTLLIEIARAGGFYAEQAKAELAK